MGRAVKDSTSMSPSLSRARRLVQLIERQITSTNQMDLMASLDYYDVLTYRLSELCHLSDLPERVRTGVDGALDQHLRQWAQQALNH